MEAFPPEAEIAQMPGRLELIADQTLEPRCSSTITNQKRAHGLLKLARERTRSFSRSRRLSSSSSSHVRVGSFERSISAEPKEQAVTKKNTPSCKSTKMKRRQMGHFDVRFCFLFR